MQWRPLFSYLPRFRSLGQKSKNNFIWFLEEMRTRKFASEIYWPLKFWKLVDVDILDVECLKMLNCLKHLNLENVMMMKYQFLFPRWWSIETHWWLWITLETYLNECDLNRVIFQCILTVIKTATCLWNQKCST